MQTPPLAFFPKSSIFKYEEVWKAQFLQTYYSKQCSRKNSSFFYLVLPSLSPYIDLRTHTTPDLVFPSKE